MRFAGWEALCCMAAASCNVPSVVERDGREYRTEEWEGGTFAYRTYNWDGGGFDDAVELERDLVRWARERGISQLPVGRFPSSRRWQLGFVTSDTALPLEFRGRRLDTLTIPAGTYATLLGRGHPENMFFHWRRLERRVEKDGYRVVSPVFEVYTDLLADSVSERERVGEIRYRIEPEQSRPGGMSMPPDAGRAPRSRATAAGVSG
jgi:hypothetical protein